MSYELIGKIYKVFDTVTKSDFQSREFVVKTDGEYPQYVKLQTVKDNCEKINPGHEGQSIKVWFDLRGREWSGKFFTNLNAWKFEIAEGKTDLPF
jgi:single-strand DNA-binding protein